MTVPSKVKRLTKSQTQVLLKRYQVKPHANKKQKCLLAKSLGISKGRAGQWSKNRHAKTKETGLLLKGKSISSKFQYCTINVKLNILKQIQAYMYKYARIAMYS